MKSIKEKAKEHSLEPMANARCGYDEEDLENSFEQGANYVLDSIEKVFAENTNPISPDSHVLYCIRDRINQLRVRFNVMYEKSKEL